MSTIRLHQLEGFFHVARLGGYTKAAQAFSYPIGQPAVYQQVRGLQEDLGITLVVQAGPRRTELTPEGRALYEFLSPFFDGLPKLLERITEAAAAPLVLAADQFLAMEALPAALSETIKQFPGFRLRLEESPTEEIVRCVSDGEADAGLVHLAEMPNNVVWEELGRIGVALIVPRTHPLAKLRRAPTPGEIAKHPLIVYGPSSPRRVLTEHLFRHYGQRLQVAVEVSFSHTMRAFVREGLAPAFVPYLLGNDLPSEPGAVTFDVSPHLKGGALPFGLLYRQGTEESVAFRALAGVLRKLWK